MATIRLGNFGQAVAAPTQTGRVPESAFQTNDQLGEVTQRVAGQRIAQDNAERQHEADFIRQDIARQEREAKAAAAKELEQTRRNTMATAFANYQVDTSSLAEDISARLTDGQISREAAQKEMTDGLTRIKKERVASLDASSQAELQDNLILFDGRANARLQGAIQTNARKERIATFTGLAESLERMGTANPAAAIEQAQRAYTTEGAAVLGADVAAKQFQAFSEKVWANHFMERLNGVRNNAKGLAALSKEIDANTAIDPEKKNILSGRIIGFQSALEARAQRAEQSRMAGIEHQIKAIDSMILKGFEPSAAQMNTLLTASKGTAYEPMVRQQIAFGNQTAAFRSAPPQKQEAMLNTWEANVRKNPTPDGIKMVDSMRSIFDAQQKAVKEDPISFAAQKDLAKVQPLDLTKPDTLGDQISARLDIARGMRSQYGAPIKVLTQAEAGDLSRFLRDAPTKQKAQYLGALAGAVRDRDAYMSVMQQVAPDDPVTALAGVYAHRGMESMKGRVVSDAILRGQAMLAPNVKGDGTPGGSKLFKMPEDQKLIDEFNTYAGNAFAAAPQIRNTYVQAAKAIYADMSAQEGDFSGEMKSNDQTWRWKNAMQLATGGINDYNGRHVVLPYGMKYGDFKDGVRERATAMAASGKLDKTLTPARLAGLPLENVGDGRYVFRSGDGVLVGTDGKPLVIDFNQPAR